MTGPLLQEKYWNGDPWRVLVVCVFLNQTTGTTAESTIAEFFELWPTAEAAASANWGEVYCLVARLGFGSKRTDFLIRMSQQWQAGERRVLRLAGCGPYAEEAYRMLVNGRLDFMPHDKELRRRMVELLGEHR